ncbi:MAG TPA: Uma2 family endonuclease [Chloroflexota bacterium]|nr:Uma2 family endonuclease [Chloroflexota bacterium]
MATARQPVTLEEFLRLPEAKLALEFENGRIIQKVLPKGRHSIIQAAIVELVNHFARPRRLAFAFPELRATFAGHSYVPNVSIYRWDRIARTPQGTVADDFLVAPDVAIEIVSPDQGVNALVGRCLWYVANCVGTALLVDPSDASVLVCRSNEIPRILGGKESIHLGDSVPGLNLTVQDLFNAPGLLSVEPDTGERPWVNSRNNRLMVPSS